MQMDHTRTKRVTADKIEPEIGPLRNKKIVLECSWGPLGLLLNFKIFDLELNQANKLLAITSSNQPFSLFPLPTHSAILSIIFEA